MDLDLRACEGSTLPQDKCSGNAEMDVQSVTIYSSPNPPQQNPNSTRKSGGVCNQDCERKVIGKYAKSTCFTLHIGFADYHTILEPSFAF